MSRVCQGFLIHVCCDGWRLQLPGDPRSDSDTTPMTSTRAVAKTPVGAAGASATAGGSAFSFATTTAAAGNTSVPGTARSSAGKEDGAVGPGLATRSAGLPPRHLTNVPPLALIRSSSMAALGSARLRTAGAGGSSSASSAGLGLSPLQLPPQQPNSATGSGSGSGSDSSSAGAGQQPLLSPQSDTVPPRSSSRRPVRASPFLLAPPVAGAGSLVCLVCWGVQLQSGGSSAGAAGTGAGGGGGGSSGAAARASKHASSPSFSDLTSPSSAPAVSLWLALHARCSCCVAGSSLHLLWFAVCLMIQDRTQTAPAAPGSGSKGT